VSIVFKNVSYNGDSSEPVNDISMDLPSGSFTILLSGRSDDAGKATICKLLLGIIQPTSGTILIDGKDASDLPTQKRNAAMVHQEFINYPHLTVYENIASPLRVLKIPKPQIRRAVYDIAKKLRIESCLNRLPSEISGGQQQRTALARALIKDAKLVCLYEPLVNLDYKLREELRNELKHLFRSTNTVCVYATAEPNEALQLGSQALLMHEGKILQASDIAEIYRKPINLTAAQILSDPPLNILEGEITPHEILLGETQRFPKTRMLEQLPAGKYILAIRPSHVSLVPTNDDDLEISMCVNIAEISGSETLIHTVGNNINLLMNLSGVHDYSPDTKLKVYIPSHKLFVFSATGKLVQAPDVNLK